VETAIARIRKHAADYGRRIDDDHFGVLFNYCFARDSEEAARLARPYALRNRTDVDFAETSALGTPQDIAGAIQRFIDAGASKFVARPACPPEAIHDQLRRLGNEVIPRFT
jgi:alkanesulfonate monooxygenase SsuD/methylene tetrahydromethanopterin reductase-like flavin-dependent oxidoreductase (luciferase family)